MRCTDRGNKKLKFEKKKPDPEEWKNCASAFKKTVKFFFFYSDKHFSRFIFIFYSFPYPSLSLTYSSSLPVLSGMSVGLSIRKLIFISLPPTFQSPLPISTSPFYLSVCLTSLVYHRCFITSMVLTFHLVFAQPLESRHIAFLEQSSIGEEFKSNRLGIYRRGFYHFPFSTQFSSHIPCQN